MPQPAKAYAICLGWPARSDSTTTMITETAKLGSTIRSGRRKQAMSIADTVTSIDARTRYPTISSAGASSNRSPTPMNDANMTACTAR